MQNRNCNWILFGTHGVLTGPVVTSLHTKINVVSKSEKNISDLVILSEFDSFFIILHVLMNYAPASTNLVNLERCKEATKKRKK